MAKAKTAIAAPVYIAAVLKQMRLFSERTQMIDTRERKAGSQLKATAIAQSNIGLGVLLSPEGEQRLVINHGYKVSIRPTDDSEPLCEYESEYRAVFKVTSLSGIDLTVPPPVSAVETYIQQVAWAARSRAQSALGQMGLGGVVLPSQDSYSPELSTEQPKATSVSKVDGSNKTATVRKPRRPI